MKGLVIFTFLAVTLYFCTARPSSFIFDNDKPTDKVSGADYTTCTNVPILGNTCIEIFVFPTNLTLGVSLIVNGKVLVTEEIEGNNLCLDDNTLLELITYIPALLPFKPVIDELIAVLGFIPAEAFSVCLDIHNMTITTTYASGCPELTLVLMCFEQSCLYKGVEPFECFHIKY
eukprot:TRINITY_DN5226_c0_g1_i1.p1 TRINITY_DN5226_c0_g1~~TRINITY_DN5226_c0_g1_i1.p1  ORF type:complete len:174 (-),score=18.73 TRINITY_DN5226_c0_g1_i1:75-596(-)